MKPPRRPSAWWWKCACCNAELHRSKRAHGTCICWECDAISPAKTQMALWAQEWKAVAWMALAMRSDGVDWDNAEYITSLFDDDITERWVGPHWDVPEQFLPKDDYADK